jgi:hypothetical protein
MRAGPLSNSKVIEVLNKYYVPVTSSNEEAGDLGKGSPAEKTERRRIYDEFLNKKLGVGDVHVYILAPDGHAIASLDIGSAEDADKEYELLRQVVARLHTEPGQPAIPPRPQSFPPAAAADAMILHLVSRHLPIGGSWTEYPAENWIVLAKSDWIQLLPPGGIAAKASWDVPLPVAVKLVEWIYPQAEEVELQNRSRVDLASLHLTVTTLSGGGGRARIDGRVRLRHSFYPGKPSEDYANSKLLGYMDFDVTQGLIQRLRMVTTEATYTTSEFATSIVSISRETFASSDH